MEDQIKAAGIPCVGKELTGLLYELNTSCCGSGCWVRKQISARPM